ncbi:MAG: conjugative transposon protein TraN [Lachnospiraceae bacterium]|jgi:conjugative transposon TraN protein|nr:conjugative transposon protein TraN [Prevotella sp.]MBP9985457.1 conjugative transposon protein TraN [Prevotella sp.]MDD3414526.1 conjugative transposon protein TraN [Lachnospiraceae bacterium]
MRNIIVTLLILLCTTVNAQQAGIQEINSSSFAVSDKITYHIIFPTDIKYFSIGDDNVAGEKIAVFPRAIRLKAAGKPFKKTTNMSVVTADGKYYSYNISYSEYLNETYRAIEGNYASPYNIEVNDKQQTHFILPEEIVYVDFGNELEVNKASGVDNILALRATKENISPTNVSVITSSGKFYTFNLKYSSSPESFSFVIDAPKRERVALFDNNELTSTQKENIRTEINTRFQSISKLTEDFAGIRFAVTNIFIDKDILYFKFKITNYSNIDYQPDFVRFYIQDAKILKKTTVQQLEQVPLFFFDQPKRINAHDTKIFSVALNKFTIPDKKILIVEMQESSGGRHFIIKVKNRDIIEAEILNGEVKNSSFRPTLEKILSK